jgi:hypothetical protein
MWKVLGLRPITKTLTLTLAAMLGLCFGPSARAGLILEIATVAGANVEFSGSGTGATFQFDNNGSGQGFEVTGSTGAGDSVGLFGTLGGTYSYTAASIQNPFPGVEYAPVFTSGGSLSITDSSSIMLTGTIAGIDVATLGSGGAVNVNGIINLSDVSYAGTNADLTQLSHEAALNGGIVTVSFQFGSVTSLTQLTASGADNSTSYSGSFATSSVPEPSSLALGAIGALGVIGFTLRRRTDRRGVV